MGSFTSRFLILEAHAHEISHYKSPTTNTSSPPFFLVEFVRVIRTTMCFPEARVFVASFFPSGLLLFMEFSLAAVECE